MFNVLRLLKIAAEELRSLATTTANKLEKKNATNIDEATKLRGLMMSLGMFILILRSVIFNRYPLKDVFGPFIPKQIFNRFFSS